MDNWWAPTRCQSRIEPAATPQVRPPAHSRTQRRCRRWWAGHRDPSTNTEARDGITSAQRDTASRREEGPTAMTGPVVKGVPLRHRREQVKRPDRCAFNRSDQMPYPMSVPAQMRRHQSTPWCPRGGHGPLRAGKGKPCGITGGAPTYPGRALARCQGWSADSGSYWSSSGRHTYRSRRTPQPSPGPPP